VPRTRLQREFDTGAFPDALWQEIKLQYVGLLTHHKQPELAETFFNSVSCKILQRTYYHNDFMFVRPAVSTEYLESGPPPYRSYYPLKDGPRSEAWYPVASNDVFPEEFGPFLLSGDKVRAPFLEYHRDLLAPDFWNETKARIAAGHIADVFPYPESARFRRRFGHLKDIAWQTD
jgi:isocitrate dehydrogenase kinase/phosphatase